MYCESLLLVVTVNIIRVRLNDVVIWKSKFYV